MRAVVCAALLSGACATFPADRDYTYRGQAIAGVGIDKVPVHGFPAFVTFHDNKKTPFGELLAVDDTDIYLVQDGGMRSFPRDGVAAVTIKFMGTEDLPFAVLWSVLTTLGAGGTGWFAPAVMLPVAIASSVVVTSAAADNRVVVKPENFIFLRQYARFPQGLPPSFVFR